MSFRTKTAGKVSQLAVSVCFMTAKARKMFFSVDCRRLKLVCLAAGQHKQAVSQQCHAGIMRLPCQRCLPLSHSVLLICSGFCSTLHWLQGSAVGVPAPVQCLPWLLCAASRCLFGLCLPGTVWVVLSLLCHSHGSQDIGSRDRLDAADGCVLV